MAAIFLAGLVGYRQLPVSALPQVDYPTIQVIDLLPGREPGRHGLVGHRAARAAVRPDPGLNADDVDELVGSSVDHAAVRARPRHRRGRAGGAGGDQRRGHLPAARPAEPADLQQGQSRRHADPHARAHLADAAAAEGAGPRRHAPRAEDLAAAGRRPGQHQRRAEAGGARAGQSDGARVATGSRSRTCARALAQRTSTRRRAASTARIRLTRSAPTIRSLRARSTVRLVIAYRNGAPVRLSDVADVVDDVENVQQAAWMNRSPAVILNIQRQPGANIIDVVDRIKRLLPQLTASLPSAVELDRAHRPHDHHPRVGPRRRSSS